jgi:hypothetical protein
VPHIHTRWSGHDGPPIDALGLLANYEHQQWEWGSLWTTTFSGVIGDREQEWTIPAVEAAHRVAIYQLEKAVTRTGGGVVGVASPVPAETAAILAQLQGFLRQAGARIAPLRTDLSPPSLFRLSNCQIESVRTVEPHGYTIDQFSSPIDVGQLQIGHGLDQISGITALLYHGGSQVVVNLFDDNQFYVADSAPDAIGEIARQISPLWEETTDARVS